MHFHKSPWHKIFYDCKDCSFKLVYSRGGSVNCLEHTWEMKELWLIGIDTQGRSNHILTYTLVYLRKFRKIYLFILKVNSAGLTVSLSLLLNPPSIIPKVDINKHSLQNTQCFSMFWFMKLFSGKCGKLHFWAPKHEHFLGNMLPNLTSIT